MARLPGVQPINEVFGDAGPLRQLAEREPLACGGLLLAEEDRKSAGSGDFHIEPLFYMSQYKADWAGCQEVWAI